MVIASITAPPRNRKRERETNWPCDGTDEEMTECGMNRKEEEDGEDDD